jgi:CIC family chloride channel protein
MLGLATLFSLGFAKEMTAWFPNILPYPGILAIAGMAALVSASAYTPLTALIITIEITDNYQLLLPMIVCCLTATMTAQRIGGEPIYSVLLHKSLKSDP